LRLLRSRLEDTSPLFRNIFYNDVHRRVVYAMAARPSATTAWNICPSADRAVAVFDEAPLPAVPVAAEAVPVVVTMAGDVVKGDNGAMEDNAVVGVAEVDALSAAVVVTPIGEDWASAGLASLPSPQGIALPSG